jgi:hypothetical protein
MEREAEGGKSMKYLLADIKFAWESYQKADVFSIMRNGKWEDTPLLNGAKPPAKIEGTAAKTQPLKKVMDFPEFLEKNWK